MPAVLLHWRTARRHHPQGRSGNAYRDLGLLLCGLLYHHAYGREGFGRGAVECRDGYVDILHSALTHSHLSAHQGYERLVAA